MMLRKRTRSHQKDQLQMGHLMVDTGSEVLVQKHKTNNFLSVPGVFIGLAPMVSESDSVRSPTSPLDFRAFSNPCNLIRSPKSSHEVGNQKSWDCRKVGLSIIDSLVDEPNQSDKLLRSSDSKNILFGPQMRKKTPNFRSHFDSFDAPKSLPKNFAIFPYPHAKPSNLQICNSDVLFGIGEAPLEPNPCGKIQSFSLDSGRSDGHLANLAIPKANLSAGNFCSENGTSPISLSSQFLGGSPNLSGPSDTKLISFPVSHSSGNDFIGSLSASDIEISEDYTCVRTHGPNPKTTHIFGDCILECHNNEFTILSKKEGHKIALPQEAKSSEFLTPYPSSNFLSLCYHCKKKLDGEDIYMYRGEKAFCSYSCRAKEILIEEEKEKNNYNSLANCLKPEESDHELFETRMFIAS